MKNKIFYGWYMLLGMVFMYASTNGIAMYAFGILRKMQAAQTPSLGLDAQTQALLPSLLFLTVALVSPFVGRLIDRFDTKKIITFGAFLTVIITFSQQFMTNYSGLVVIYVLFAIAISLTGIISFMYLINKWFRKNIGLAAGILLLGSSFGGIIFPKIAASAANWQSACNSLAVVAALFLFLPLLLIKNSPTEIGETPDGLPIFTQNTEGGQNIHEGMTLREAMRTSAFYLVLLVTGILWFCINGYIQNHAFFMTDLGKNAGETAAILGIFSMMAILGKLLFGWLSDRFERTYIMLLSIGFMLISIFVLKMCQADASWLRIFALIFGVGFGGSFSIIQIWVADIYAGKNFGSILGVVTMVDTIAGSAGMILMGSMRKSSGSFEGGFNLMLGLCVLALISTLFIKKKGLHHPEKKAK